MQLDPTDVKTVSAATTDSVMKKTSQSLWIVRPGVPKTKLGASYATVTGYLAAAKEQRLMPALLRWITPTFLLRVRKGLVSVQNKDSSNAVQTFTTADRRAKVIDTAAPMLFNYNVGYLKISTVSGGLVAADAMFIATYQ